MTDGEMLGNLMAWMFFLLGSSSFRRIQEPSGGILRTSKPEFMGNTTHLLTFSVQNHLVCRVPCVCWPRRLVSSFVARAMGSEDKHGANRLWPTEVVGSKPDRTQSVGGLSVVVGRVLACPAADMGSQAPVKSHEKPPGCQARPSQPQLSLH